MKAVKEYIKENLVLCILFAFVVFGLGGYKVYTLVRNTIEKNVEYSQSELTEVVDENQDYGVNEYRVIEKTDQDLAEFYYTKIRKMWVNDPGSMYDKMTDKCKSYYDSRDAFIAYMNKYKTSLTPTSTVDSYSVNGTKIIIETSEGWQFKVKSKGINDYQITLVGRI